MNLRKWCGLTAALLCLVLALTACSGTPTESTVSAPTTPTTTPTTAAPTPADLYAAAAAADQKMSDLNGLGLHGGYYGGNPGRRYVGFDEDCDGPGDGQE